MSLIGADITRRAFLKLAGVTLAAPRKKRTTAHVDIAAVTAVTVDAQRASDGTTWR